MKHRLRGKKYKVTFTQKISKKYDGTCDNPNRKFPQIKINSSLSKSRELRVVLHEALHACYWDLDEEAIDEGSIDICKLLWKLGWRKTK